MSWYKKAQSVKDKIRYRATAPLDILIEDTGNEEFNQNQAYEKIIEILSVGSSNVKNSGFDHQLYPSDIQRY